MAGWAIGAAAMTVATIAAVSMTVSMSASAEAQKEVAETNARATVEAARLAADAQVDSQVGAAQATAEGYVKEAEIDRQRDLDYLAFEEKAMAQETDMDSYYRSVQNQVDEIDTFYSENGSWGTASGGSYDYGHDGGGADMQFS